MGLLGKHIFDDGNGARGHYLREECFILYLKFKFNKVNHSKLNYN